MSKQGSFLNKYKGVKGRKFVIRNPRGSEIARWKRIIIGYLVEQGSFDVDLRNFNKKGDGRGYSKVILPDDICVTEKTLGDFFAALQSLMESHQVVITGTREYHTVTLPEPLPNGVM